MPQKEFSGGSGSDPATVMRTLDGHIIVSRNEMENMSEPDFYKYIDHDRNVQAMTEVPLEEGDVE